MTTATVDRRRAAPRVWLFAVLCAAAAVTYGLPYRPPDCNTASHFALVQMLANGQRSIDRIHGESCDVSWSAGHFYSNKAPGLALVTVPWYLLLRSVGALEPDRAAGAAYPLAMRSIPRRDLWLLGLWGAVLPALGALALVRRLAERVEPGAGVLVAATLGFATLLLPFASLYFSHALAAFVALSAFALAVGRRRPVLAGALAGFGIAVEYPLGLLAVALGVSLLVRRELHAAARYGGGLIVGVIPLLVFNAWVFGSPFHLSYVGAVLVPGVTGHDVLGANTAGFFGLGWPHANAALHVLAGRRGLLSVAPVLLLVPVGLVVSWRRGQRFESGLIAAVLCLFLIYNFGYYSPLGGATPGPRLLVCVLGIAVLALAPICRLAPFTMCALVLASTTSLLAAHLTQPLISPPYDTGDWWEWLGGSHYTATIIAPSAHTWLGAAPIAVAALGGVAVSSLSLVPAGRADSIASAAGVSVWLLCLAIAPANMKSYAALAGSIAAIVVLFGLGRIRQVTDILESIGLHLRSLSVSGRILWVITALLVLDIGLRML